MSPKAMMFVITSLFSVVFWFGLLLISSQIFFIGSIKGN